MTTVAGYDVGGAHLKVALVADGALVDVRQIPCALWRGVDQLDVALGEARAVTGDAPCHAVTMTGELADVFPDRYTGVVRLVEHMSAALTGTVTFWSGTGGFRDAASAIAAHDDVASANFLATAALCARLAEDGLVIDMGSTTTDIIAFEGGKVAARGLTDAARLKTGELVYTGLTRTTVMAVADRGLFQGSWQGLAREGFATMADVRRVLGSLPDGVDLHATADGRGTSIAESRARLARCFGRDPEPGDERAWEGAAHAIAQAQLRTIEDGCLQVLSGARLPPGVRVITAGIGAHEAALVAGRLGMPSLSFGALCGAPAACRDGATHCAPAVATALLSAASHPT